MTHTLSGLKRKLDEIYSYVGKLEELEATPAPDSQMPPLSPHSADTLKMLRKATEEGRAIPKVALPRGKWNDTACQRKCHGQWLDASCFNELHKKAVWSTKAWHSLEAVRYKVDRNGEVPETILMCSSCIHVCPMCSEYALTSELSTHGLCRECGQCRTELIMRENSQNKN